MNPITALMLTRAIEDDRRREIARRPHRLIEAEPMRDEPRGPRSWSLRLPRLGFAGSKG